MMNTQTSVHREEEDDTEEGAFFTRNPLASLSVSHSTGDCLGSTGWCQCVDSNNNEFFIHTSTGAISYDMPDEQVRHRLSIQRECVDKLTSALQAIDVSISDPELNNLRIEIQTDMAIIEAACSVVHQSVCSATETTDALARAETNLVRLEELAMTRSGDSLWGMARDAIGPSKPVSNVWSTLIDNIHRVRENLRPVQVATGNTINSAEEQNAWVRSLRGKLKPISSSDHCENPLTM